MPGVTSARAPTFDGGKDRETTERALRLLADPDPPTVDAPEGRPHRRLDDRQHRGVGHREGDGPPVPDRAPGRQHGPGRAQLGLARLRDARRLLAAARRADQAQDPRHHRHQRARVPSPTRRWRARCWTPAGSSWATASSRAPCICCPTSAPPSASRSSSCANFTGKKPQGLARPRPHARRGRRSTSSPRRGSSTSPTG